MARAAAPRSRRGGNTRANQALELVREKPGITIPEIAQAMKIEPNYLYRVLPRLASDGQVKRDGQGWHPAPSSTSTRTEPVRNRSRTQADARRPRRSPTASATRAARTRRSERVGIGDQRPDRPRCHQGVGARRARRRRRDDCRPGRHEGRARAPDRLDDAVEAGQDRRGPEGRARLPTHLRVLKRDRLSGRRGQTRRCGEPRRSAAAGGYP